MQYFDHLGQHLKLGRQLGAGGEGAVFEITGSPDQVAKVYHRPPTDEKLAKLTAMLSYSTAEVASVSAWPQGTIHAANSRAICGVILPRINGYREVHELYSPAHRKIHFPTADFRFLVRTARNCSRAFSTLHNRGIVIGDVNQGNIFVSAQALVRLIDCDSFQITSRGTVYKCLVGMAHFIPPELQVAQLGEVLRTSNHDNFGLAILIFHLLFMGRHPFVGRYLGKGDMPVELAIRQYRYAFGRRAAEAMMAPPPNSLPLDSLPSDIGNLFEQSFCRGSEVSGSRPNADTWERALGQLEDRMVACPNDRGHYFSNHQAGCPWCGIERRGGPYFFISVSIQALDGRRSTFDIEKVWSAIDAVQPPLVSLSLQNGIHSVPASLQGMAATPIPATSDEFKPLRWFCGIVSLLALSLSLLGLRWPSVGMVFGSFGGIALLGWLCFKAASPLGRIKQMRWRELRNARDALTQAKQQRVAILTTICREFENAKRILEKAKDFICELSAHRANEINKLSLNLRERQKDEFLRNKFISEAKIYGIGPVRLADLEYHGIDTAADVVDWRIDEVPGFGEELVSRLLKWRQEVEAEFQFVQHKGVPIHDINALELKYAQKRLQYEDQLVSGPNQLRKIVERLRNEGSVLDAKVRRCEVSVAQAELDLKALDHIPWWY